MPYPPKPSDQINWTDGAAAKVTEPSAGKKLLGWTGGEKPPFQYMNWLLWQLNNWSVYFEGTTDLLKAAVASQYDIVVDGVLVVDINAANAIAIPGNRILVKASWTSNTIQQITITNTLWDFAPGSTISNGTAATGIQISSTGVRLRGGRLSTFTTAILIDAAAAYTTVGEMRFAGCTADITDNNGTGTSYALITE